MGSKNKFRKLRKFFSEKLFNFIYGKVNLSLKKCKDYSYQDIKLGNSSKYKIHFMRNSRIYFNKITDVAYINNNKIICQPSIQQKHFTNKRCSENSVLKKGTPSFIHKVNGSLCSFIYSESAKDNYWHWIFDVLPKIAIFEKKINLNKIDYLLFPEIKNRFQIETLDAFKIPQNKRISGFKYNHIYSKKIISCDHPFNKKNIKNDHQKLPKWIGDWYKTIIKLNKIKRKKKMDKIYIDRSDSKNIFRTIINEEELKKFLASKSFKIVQLSKMSFLSQVKLFYNASCVVGLHGAGFANLVFCRPKTKVIEIATTMKSKNIIYYLAKANNLNYKCIFFKSVNKRNESLKSIRYQDKHVKININKFRQVL